MDEMKQESGQFDASLPVENVQEEPRTPVERMTDMARGQASEAAEALRRGEFMRGAELDSAATPDDRLIALLSYASQVVIPFILPIIVLISESSKRRPFQRYHAVQSLALAVVFGVMGVAMGVGSMILWVVPIIGWIVSVLTACLIPILWAMGVIAMLYYGYQAYQGKRFAIPGLTGFLHDQGWL